MEDHSSSTHKKYQPARKDILWNTDWGRPPSAMNQHEPKALGFCLYKGRWVTPDERRMLKRQRGAYRWIRIIAVSFIVVGSALALLMLTLIFLSRTWPTPALYEPTIFGIACAVIGFGLYRFERWARYASIILSSVTVFILLYRCLDHHAGYFNAGMIVTLVIILYFMMRKTVRLVFTRERVQEVKTEFTWYKTTFGKLLIAGPLVTITIFVLLMFLGEKKMKECDAAAADDIRRLHAAIGRLAEEAKDHSCDPADIVKGLSGDQLKYIPGPYYGWRGTHPRCKVLVRIEGNELRGCAVRGSRPNVDREKRLIYRVPLLGDGVLSPTEGLCTGRQYGFFPDHLYFASMLETTGEKCVLREPEEGKFKPDLWKEYHEELERYRKK
jgi:hypothetical protein